MLKFFKRSYPKLDFKEFFNTSKAARKMIKDLISENKALHIKLNLFSETLERQNKIIKMLEGEKKNKLVKSKNLHKN